MKSIISLKSISLLLCIISSSLISDSISKNLLKNRDYAAAEANFTARLQLRNKNCTEYLADGQVILNEIVTEYNLENVKKNECLFKCGQQSIFETIVGKYGTEKVKNGKDAIRALINRQTYGFAQCESSKLKLLVTKNKFKIFANMKLKTLATAAAAITEDPVDHKIRQRFELKNYNFFQLNFIEYSLNIPFYHCKN